MPTVRPRASRLVHGVLTRPMRRDMFTRHRYDRPLGRDEVELTWLGTAGIALRYRESTLLIDPYLSRPGLQASLTNRLRPDLDALRRHSPQADAIVCSHSHHDHILDVPEIARLTGALVVGSDASANYCRAHGLPASQIIQVDAPRTVQLGPFAVTVKPSLHGRAVAGRVPLVGTIEPGIKPPLRLREFRNDTTFGVLVEAGEGDRAVRLFHLGSADFLPETLDGVRCDVLMPCMMGRDRRAGFTRDLVDAVRPRVVIPFHFDDFFSPLDLPIRELPGADLDGFRREVQRTGAPCRVVVLDLKGRFRFSADDPALPPRDWG